MHLKIKTITQFANPKEPQLGGIIKTVTVYAEVKDLKTAFPFRYKIKDGKVTVI